MRFHHSTRRGHRNRLNQSQAGSLGVASHRALHHSSTSTSRWSQLGFCRETNIHFHRRTPVEPPDSWAAPQAAGSTRLAGSSRLLDSGAESFEALLEAGAKQQPEGQGGVAAEEANRAAAAASIDMETARAKLLAQVQKHTFWSSKAARRMQLTGVDERRIHIYELTSFCERRDLEWRYEPYRGGLVNAVPFRRVPASGELAQQLSAPLRFAPEPRARHVSVGRASSAQRAPATPTSPPPTTPPSAGDAATAAAAARPTSADSFWSGSLASGDSPSGGRRQRAASARSASPNFRRSFSSGSHARLSVAAAAATSSAAHLYEPVSALEQRRAPSREFVWAVEARGEPSSDAWAGRATSMELPHSSFVKRCHGCQGKGRLKCATCNGVGHEVCLSCSGFGRSHAHSATPSSAGRWSRYAGSDSYKQAARNSPHANGYDQDDDHYARSSADSAPARRYNEPGGISGSGQSSWLTEACHFCHGAGQKRCWACAGKSYQHCLGCCGTGQLRCFLNLNVSWLNHRDELVLNDPQDTIPRDRLRLATGELLLDESAARLAPLELDQLAPGASSARQRAVALSAQEAEQLHLASRRLLERHTHTYKQERLIKQRQRVTQIECHVVHYEWRQRRGQFVIYGLERKVYIAKYPFKSLCTIT